MITIYISKADTSLNIDWDAMPENAKRHIIEYGLRQKLNDAGSAATTKELGKDEAGKQALAMAETTLEALMEGKVTVRQAAMNISLEDRFFTKELKTYHKKAFGKTDGLDNDTMLADLAKKLGRSAADIQVAIEKKAAAALETHKKIQSLKAEIPDISL